MKRKRKRRIRKSIKLAAAIMVTSVIGAGSLYILSKFYRPEAPAKVNVPAQQQPDSKPVTEPKTASFHFNGVGDNLLHDPIFIYYEQDTGTRDFLPIYEHTLPYTQNADLAYINFETICAGDEFGLSGYPNFNGPLEMMASLQQAGFDWFSTSSNHSFDRGVDGLMSEMNYISENLPDVVYTGSARSFEESVQPKVKEVNGIKVGLESFTYGLNGYRLPEGYDWLVNLYTREDGGLNYDLMRQKVEALKEVSDVQIVSMHWGNEYQTAPDELQKEAARFLHELGVEVIIGSHPHVIQPAEILKSNDQETLVYYSLGNFISAQDSFDTMIGGMADFDLNYDFNSKKTTFANVKFIPTITYISEDLRTYRTLTIHEYNNDWAADHFVTRQMNQDMSKEAVQAFVAQTMQNPENIEVVYE